MTTLATTGEGNTPLSPEELADLIPNLATKEDLNEWERENILQAREWAGGDRTSPLAYRFRRIRPQASRKDVRPNLEVGGGVSPYREKHRSSSP